MPAPLLAIATRRYDLFALAALGLPRERCLPGADIGWGGNPRRAENIKCFRKLKQVKSMGCPSLRLHWVCA
jgi:hypothetical protein